MAQRVNFCACGRAKDGKAKTCRKCFNRAKKAKARRAPRSSVDMSPEAIKWRADRLLSEIHAAAIEDRFCPSNAELARICGYQSESAVSNVLARFVRQGRITSERIGDRRVVTFPEGMSTRDPREHIRDIVAKASIIFGLDEEIIYSRRRTQPIARVRRAVCAVASEDGMSTPVIGSVLDRDHTSILHACQGAPVEAARDRGFAERLAELRYSVRGEPLMLEAAE